MRKVKRPKLSRYHWLITVRKDLRPLVRKWNKQRNVVFAETLYASGRAGVKLGITDSYLISRARYSGLRNMQLMPGPRGRKLFVQLHR